MLRRLETVCPGAQLTVGNYTYLDGALHVQLALACDAIMQRLCAARAARVSTKINPCLRPWPFDSICSLFLRL